jgi:hypothetical protein
MFPSKVQPLTTVSEEMRTGVAMEWKWSRSVRLADSAGSRGS